MWVGFGVIVRLLLLLLWHHLTSPLSPASPLVRCSHYVTASRISFDFGEYSDDLLVIHTPDAWAIHGYVRASGLASGASCTQSAGAHHNASHHIQSPGAG